MTISEEQRLSKLQLYRIMDTESEKSFDNLTRLASRLCDCPISLVSLVDDRRQWFKSRVGLNATETPREMAFCAHAIQESGLFVVEDTWKDQRFVDNPLVTDAPNIRFYAGAPLEVEQGVRLGTLCVIDDSPRTLDGHKRETLETIRDSVVSLLKLRYAQEQLDVMEKILPMCSWCSNIRVGDEQDGEWIEPRSYVSSHNLVSHGICPSCAEAARREMKPDS